MRGTVLETCSLEKIFICRCKNIRNRTPYGVGGEAGEAAPPTLATEDGAKATTGCGWLLKRDEEATCILMYVGGVEIAAANAFDL